MNVKNYPINRYVYLDNETFLDILLFLEKRSCWILCNLSNFVGSEMRNPVFYKGRKLYHAAYVQKQYTQT